MLTKTSLVTLFCVIHLHMAAQDFPRKDLNLEKLADEIFPTQNLDLNYEELYENLAQLISNPLEVNTATREQLQALLVISEMNINALLTYREEVGPLVSIYELQSVPGWSRKDFDRAIPFLMVMDPQARLNAAFVRRVIHEKNNYLLFRVEREIESKKGYADGTDSIHRYAGSPDKIYLRFRTARSNDFSIGLTAEKDAGEPLRWAPAENQYYFDYISWHLQVQNKGRVRNLIIGDFQSQFGQGLILGSVFGFGKNSESITTVRRSNMGFLPYTSLNENIFLRGLAASFHLLNGFTVHTFGSQVYKDGTFYTTTDESTFLSSFSASGLHRTANEIHGRKQVQEINAGGVLQFKRQNIDAGIIFHHSQFSHFVQPNQFAYNQFAFRGQQNDNAGIYINYNLANFTFFTEVAQTLGHGRSVIAGLLGNINPSLEIALLCRDFDKEFYSFYSNAFSENTIPQNEKGIYWGWKYAFNKKYSASGYLDLFTFPWIRYRGYAPSDGSEWLFRFNYTPSKTISIFLQTREESKIRNFSEATHQYFNDIGVKRSYWLSCDYTALPGLSFKSRIQWNTYEIEPHLTRGFAIAQDVNFDLGKRWSFSLRYALFDTGDYDNRIYFYERDVWLAYSFPAYDGIGIRNYVLAQFKASSRLDLWVRWSKTRYTDRTQIGSGSELVEGNTGNDVKFQARIKF